MTEPTLTERLRDTALCETDHPATAATALITAAALILEARFPPAAIVALIQAATNEALALHTMPAAGSA